MVREMKTTDGTTKIGDGPLKARVLTGAEERERFKEQMGREHFLGDRAPAGGTVYQVIEDPAGHWCALLLWCSAGLRLKDRDAWIGWDAHQRSQRLKLVINNARFLIPDSAHKPNMASRTLSVAVAAVAGHYETQYGYRPVLAETFTDPRRHKGTCYKAAGWVAVGETAGYGRHRAEFLSHHGAAKCIWVRPLQKDAQAVLCAWELAPAQRQAQTEGTAAHYVIKASERSSLYEALHKVPDPRRRAGQSYPCAPLLTVICLGLLAGAGTLASIYRLGRRMSDAERRAVGFRRKAGGYKAPSYHTLRHLLLLIDLEALARVLTAWLQAHAGALPRHLALDGKDVRGALGMIVTLADAPSGIPVALRPAPGKGHEMKQAQQLLADPQVKLEQMTVTADALHCQTQTAHLVAQARGAEYVLQVKGNQPAVEDVARFAVPEGTPFLP
jgi:hypothetical protein